MDLTLLGTSGAYPTQGDACAGYLVQSKHKNILSENIKLERNSGMQSSILKDVEYREKVSN